jgi:Fe-S-cluster containining protein
MKNNYFAKFIRTFTAILPVSKKRVGECNRCGECCKLPNVCPFLWYDEENKACCRIYLVRSLNCHKYPRTEKEFITKETCGFRFE